MAPEIHTRVEGGWKLRYMGRGVEGEGQIVEGVEERCRGWRGRDGGSKTKLWDEIYGLLASLFRVDQLLKLVPRCINSETLSQVIHSHGFW